ncbi:MAG: hypothetical protein DBY19_04095 [Clostridia bacterium]|nr:MAG: hypothetical protein DBY19_04095 [Clostridia bacterium]
MQKEMDFIQEYQTNTIFVKSPFSEKMYLTYLNRARLFFIFKDNGEIKHQNLHLSSEYPLPTDHPYRQDIEKMLQDYISLQYESIQRIFDLINPDYSIPELTYIWQDTPSFLLEIGNSLLATGKVIPIDNKSNKNNWYKALFHFLHLAEPRYIDQPLYKLNHRENPARYLSSLLKQYEKWLSERV